MMRYSIASICIALVAMTGVCSAGELPAQAGATAVDVLGQIEQGTIPPIPLRPEIPEPNTGGAPEFPGLPDQASDTAVGVLDQLSQGIIPPTPVVPEPPELDTGDDPVSFDLTAEFPGLPENASDTARSIIEQLLADSMPPSPVTPGNQGGEPQGPPADVSVPGGGPTLTAIPEPATLSLLALGGMAMLRRRK